MRACQHLCERQPVGSEGCPLFVADEGLEVRRLGIERGRTDELKDDLVARRTLEREQVPDLRFSTAPRFARTSMPMPVSSRSSRATASATVSPNSTPPPSGR
jgi:hypothetical protein